MPAYLLDTNAVQSIGAKSLQAARNAGNQLLISPISFIELASHLDDENFQKARANVLKGRLFEILHDPLAEIMMDVGCPDAVNPSRFQDQNGVLTILAELETVDSYAALMNREIDQDGQKRPIGDFALKARNVFDQDREQFVSATRQRCKDYINCYERSGTINLAGKQFCWEATGFSHGLADDIRRAGCNVTPGQIEVRTIFGAGYVVARACFYVANLGKREAFTIDGNDFEDYFICLHLGISSGRIFVTDDKGVRVALKRTTAALEQFAQIDGRSVARNVEIITSADFKALFPSAP